MGDGTFINGSGAISTYIHGENDLRNESVRLIIRGTANSPCTNVVADTIQLLITPKPTADAGADERICEGSDITLQQLQQTNIQRSGGQHQAPGFWKIAQH